MSTAILSPCESYRYRLERTWDERGSRVGFLMLNPSTADHVEDDPTIRRCISFAKAWGHGGLIVGNLFALRSPYPKTLYGHSDPVGPENDRHLLDIACRCSMVICAWGTHGTHLGRDRQVGELLDLFDLRALRVTKKGHPGHPLYIPATAVPIGFAL